MFYQFSVQRYNIFYKHANKCGVLSHFWLFRYAVMLADDADLVGSQKRLAARIVRKQMLNATHVVCHRRTADAHSGSQLEFIKRSVHFHIFSFTHLHHLCEDETAESRIPVLVTPKGFVMLLEVGSSHDFGSERLGFCEALPVKDGFGRLPDSIRRNRRCLWSRTFGLAAETKESFAVTGCEVGTGFFVKSATNGLNGVRKSYLHSFLVKELKWSLRDVK